MKRKWEVRRTVIQRVDGQRRWDIAYQRLVQWASETEVVFAEPRPINPQEEIDESRHLRPCLNPTATTEPNH